MAFVRPLLAQIVERVQQDFVSRLSLSAPILRRSMVGVLSRVVAGAAHMLHGHLDFLAKQIFPDQADGEYLVRWGALFGLSRTAATFAVGNVTFTGTNGTVIPAGTVAVRADGAEYETQADGTVATGEATIAVEALAAGEAGNCLEGTVLSCESPIAGVDSAVTVAAGDLTAGTDEETIEAFRARVVERMQAPPHGGNAQDYVAWAKEVAGVTRAWCYPLELGAGTVVVRFMRDDDDDPIPSVQEVQDVQDHIDAVAPVTADVTVEAPTAVPLSMTLAVSPDTAAVRDAVAVALEDYLRRTASPGGTIPLSQLEVTVGTADGVTDFTFTSPTTDVTHATGEIATYEAPTFT